MLLALFLLAAYLLGSISFAIIISKIMKLRDPRSYGSGNPGTTNILRTGHKFAALLTLIADASKGYLAIFVTQKLAPNDFNLENGNLELIGLAAFIGHVLPIFHRFTGGKGVAISLGILLALNFYLGLLVLTSWCLIAYFFRYSSLAAIGSAILTPIYAVCLFDIYRENLYRSSALLIISVILIWRHKININKLLNKSEIKIQI